MKTRKLVSCILLIILIISVLSTLGVAPTTELPKAHAQGTEWLPGWRFRKAHVIIGSTAGAVTDYQVNITVYYGSGTDDRWNVYLAGLCKSDFSDVRFTASDGVTLLPYWIETKVDGQYAVFWVKVPYIPAYPNTATIYIYYGNPNATSISNGTATFLYFDDGSSASGWSAVNDNIHGDAFVYSSNGLIVCKETGYSGYYGGSGHCYKTLNIALSGSWFRVVFYHSFSASIDYNREVALGAVVIGTDGKKYVADIDAGGSSYWVYGAGRPGGDYYAWVKVSPWSANTWYRTEVDIRSILASRGYSPTPATLYMIYIGMMAGLTTFETYVDYIYVRKYISPEPSHGSWGSVEVYGAVRLGGDAVVVKHWLVYSPNSTQFTHIFTATNTSAAGYTTSYGGDAWAWRVYAKPYYSNGVAYPNTASLVSNATITLPYSPTTVYRLSLWAKTNATGSYRRLWIRVLNSAGNVVAEITNASIGTSWTNITISLNINDTKVSIWINATVSSTSSAGEEIAVRGVKLYALRISTTSSVTELKGSYYNCTTVFSVNLTDVFLNSSTVDLLLRDKLVFNRTTYPGAPTYVGTETLGSYVYKVYRIPNALATGTFYVFSTLPNELYGSRVVVRGVERYSALVGEPLTLVLPATANITVIWLNIKYTNVGNLTLSFSSPGTYTLILNRTDIARLSLGLKTIKLSIGYGAFAVNLVDADNKTLNYEVLVVSVKNLNTGATKSLTANASATVSGLAYGVHQIVAMLKGAPICSGNLDLWIGSNGSTVKLSCSIRRLSADYRGAARSVAWEFGKQLLNVSSLNARYPYAKTRYLINGTGLFRLVIDYCSYKPTAVDVKANVTISSVNWDGNYLIITGSLGSVGDIVVTDQYRLNVVAYDRLGNVLPVPATISINSSSYTSPVSVLLEPGTYIVTVPVSVNGFQFYGYGDGYRDTARAVNISTSDVTLKVFYRVPTSVEASAYQVMSLWQRLLKFLGLQQNEQYAAVYIDGKVLDYYGNGVPNRVVTVKLFTGDGMLLAIYNITTDLSGYFRTPDMMLLRNATYRVEVVYQGDDIYVNSSKSFTFNVASLPVAPSPVTPAPIPTAIMYVIATIIIVAAIVIGIKIARKTIADAIENERAFVKRKRFVTKK